MVKLLTIEEVAIFRRNVCFYYLKSIGCFWEMPTNERKLLMKVLPSHHKSCKELWALGGYVLQDGYAVRKGASTKWEPFVGIQGFDYVIRISEANYLDLLLPLKCVLLPMAIYGCFAAAK